MANRCCTARHPETPNQVRKHGGRAGGFQLVRRPPHRRARPRPSAATGQLARRYKQGPRIYCPQGENVKCSLNHGLAHSRSLISAELHEAPGTTCAGRRRSRPRRRDSKPERPMRPPRPQPQARPPRETRRPRQSRRCGDSPQARTY